MSFDFDNLDADTRRFMLEELSHDRGGAGLYRSPRLSPAGWASYPGALEDAFAGGSDGTLTAALGSPGVLNELEEYAKGTRKVASNAAQLLSEGQFNWYYMRAVCARVLAEGGTEVEIYRGRESGWHRPESDALIGQRLDAGALLEDLRANVHTPDEVTVLPDVNSGLTVKIV